MLRLFFAFLLLAWITPALAQSPLSLVGGGAGAEATTSSDSTSGASTQALIDLLKDDAARAELIAKLEAQVPADGAAAGTASGTDAAPVEEPKTFGRQVSLAASQLADTLETRAVSLWAQARRLPDRAQDFMAVLDPALVWSSLRALGFVILTTYAAYFLLRILSRQISLRLSNAATGGRFLRRAFLSLTSSGIDAAIVVLAGLAATVAAFVFYGTENQSIGPVQVNYLTAFNVVGLSIVAVRAVLAPRFSQLRLIPLETPAARTIARWLTISIAFLGYGQLLVVPLVQREAGYLPAFAASAVIGSIVMAYTIFVVYWNRRHVADWLRGGADRSEEPGGIHAVLDYWHIPVILYLLYVLVIVILRPGNILLPLLLTTAKVTALVVGGLFLRNVLRRAAEHGVRLPESLKYALPALERRLNATLPKIAIFLRAVLALIVAGGVLSIVGIISPTTWFGGADGSSGITGELVSITLIVAVAGVLWLSVASWVDFRLNPMVGKAPSSRETTLLTLLFNATTIALVVIATMLVLSEMGINIAPLLASAGVLGLAIGFGAQKMVQDIITGVFIQFENAINVGDVVSVGGITGGVEKLTVRSVSIRDLHGVFHIIPFSSVDMVSNYMRDFAYSVCDMGVAYREDMDEAKVAMFDAFEELRADEEQAAQILGDLEWMGLNSFGDSAIVLRARIKTLPGKQWGVGRAYNLILKRIFDERGIEIPFPHQTIYFGEDRKGNAPPLHIRTVGAEADAPRIPADKDEQPNDAPAGNQPDDQPPSDDGAPR